MIFLLSLAFSLWYFVNGGHVIIDCEPNCNVTDKYIKGEEGRNITLRYEVTTKKFTMFQIRYPNSEVIVILSPDGVFPQPEKTPKFIDFTNTKIRNTTLGYYFTFQVLRLNRSIRDSEFYGTLTLFEGGRMRTESKDTKLDIVFQATMLSKWISRYDAEEYSDVNIAFILSGNPKPNVTAHIDNTYFHSTSSGDINHFDYNVFLKNISRDFCGKYLLVEALGYKRPVRRSSLVNVVFTPNTPNNLAATYYNASCLDMTWNSARSGHCIVNYTLDYTVYSTYKLKEHFTSTTNSTSLSICFPPSNLTRNVTFRVRAEIWNQKSNFSGPYIITIHSPTPSPTVQSNDSLVIFIVVGVVVVIIITAVLFILARKGQLKYCHFRTKSKDDSVGAEPKDTLVVSHVNHSAENNGMEADYAHINDIQIQNQKTVSTTDYAELGPGGRVEEREETVEHSSYAQVNTERAYYPSLNPQAPKREPEPDYVPLSTALPQPKIKIQGETAEYAVSSKMKQAPQD